MNASDNSSSRNIPHDVKLAICQAKWTSTALDLARKYGLTKGQVAGIHFRHRELCPPKPSNWGGTPNRVRTNKPNKKVSALDLAAVAPAKVSPAPRVAATDSATAVLVDISGGAGAVIAVRSNECRWPSNHHPKDAEFRFCGAPAIPGKSYCPTCLQRADGRATSSPSIHRTAPRAEAIA